MVQAEASCVLYHTAVWALRSHEVGTHGLSALVSQLRPWECCQHRYPFCLLLPHSGSPCAAILILDARFICIELISNVWSPNASIMSGQFLVPNWKQTKETEIHRLCSFLTWLHYLVMSTCTYLSSESTHFTEINQKKKELFPCCFHGDNSLKKRPPTYFAAF